MSAKPGSIAYESMALSLSHVFAFRPLGPGSPQLQMEGIGVSYCNYPFGSFTMSNSLSTASQRRHFGDVAVIAGLR